MPPSPHRAELSVGLFLLIGAAVVGGLIFQFSEPGRGRRGGYPLAVEVRDATGIRAGAPVRLGGVDVGRVAGDPRLNEDFAGLSLGLEIDAGVRIPRGSTVKIDTSGLMGDRFVRILPPENPTGDFVPEGHRLKAEASSSLNDLAGEAGETLDDLADASAEIRAAADRVEALAAKLDEKVLTAENLENFRATLAALRDTSETLVTASGDIGPFLAKGRETLERFGEVADRASGSFASVDASSAKLSTTLDTVDASFATFDETLGELHATLDETSALLGRLRQGKGLAPALLNDPQLKEDFENVLDKLERFGFLFYPRERSRPESGDEPRPPAR